MEKFLKSSTCPYACLPKVQNMLASMHGTPFIHMLYLKCLGSACPKIQNPKASTFGHLTSQKSNYFLLHASKWSQNSQEQSAERKQTLKTKACDIVFLVSSVEFEVCPFWHYCDMITSVGYRYHQQTQSFQVTECKVAAQR